MSYVLGIDTSTTATKAVVLDHSGRVVASATSEYDYQTPRPQWSEQDPELWWTATCRVLSEISGQVRASQIEAVGLTGQMHGAVLLGSDGRVLRPAILWNDQRSQAECDEIRRRVGRSRLLELTGNDALTGFTSSKLLWVQRHEPDVWKQVHHILLPKDYLRFRLTGGFATDVADGSGTALFDLKAREWSGEVLAALDVERSLLPDLFEGPEVGGVVGVELGLQTGTPVVAGGGDQAANAVGLGVVEEGLMALSLGTSGVVFASTRTPVVDPKGVLHAFCHAAPGYWHLMGVMLSAAGSLRWFRDVMAPESSFGELVDGAASIEAGSEGLVFLPYLSGERTPHPDPEARGAFVGLTVRHDIRHLTRAVLEGVAYGLRDGFDLMMEAGLSLPDRIRASGGGMRSRLWRQILADVLETPLDSVNTTEGPAYGAALLAGVGQGWWDSVANATQAVVRSQPLAVPGDKVGTYREGHLRFRELYPALRSFNSASKTAPKFL